MEEIKYIVYAKLNEKKKIIAVNSSAFLKDTSNWIQIDEGIDGRIYGHAQPNYLKEIYGKSTFDENGKPNFKYENEKVVELTEGEKIDLSVLKESKHQELSILCNQTIENGQDILLSNGGTDHFTYKYFDQTNIKNAFDVAKDLKLLGHEDMEIPFYDSDNNCKKYPTADIITIYMSMQSYITYMTTLCHQLQAMVNDSDAIDFIQNLTFEEKNLSGAYLDTFNEMLEQSQKIIQVLVSE